MHLSKSMYFNMAVTKIPIPYEFVRGSERARERDHAKNLFKRMWLEMRQLFGQLSDDANVRAIVLSGAGDRAFTTGLDVQAASSGLLSGSSDASDGARAAKILRYHIGEFQDCITAIERCEKPVVAAMHGFCLGLAVDVSTAADVRVCAANAKFAVKEVDIGLAADIGTLSRLPKVVGSYGWVKEVSFTARNWGSEEALRVGFVNNVFPSKEDTVRGALELAGSIAGKSPVAVQGTKELLNYSRDRGVLDGKPFLLPLLLSFLFSFFPTPFLCHELTLYMTGLQYTKIWNSVALQTEDLTAALLSGIQKRKPTFSKL